MTDDIVARLRGRIGPTVLLSYPPQSTRDPLCCEAADEIERLRAVVQAAFDMQISNHPKWEALARAAVKETNHV